MLMFMPMASLDSQRSRSIRFAELRAVVTHSLNIIAIGIQNEGCVITCVILLANPGGSIAGATRRQACFVEGIHGGWSQAVGAKAEIGTGSQACEEGKEDTSE